ncbi:hypothetical protein AB0G74_12595 [Streptomyces sp. NPDC020875]|uniref:hypothetical protein n=1 Tax=Streptomyces sp. NPDC020875 TaxID=3154898 RepID=UPI0033E25EF4
MRDLIVRALTWTLHQLLPARGRHRAPEPSRPVPVVICAPQSPIPVHVLARTMPPPPRTFRIPPYMGPWIERQKQAQRRVAVALALAGIDYAYVPEGVSAVVL